MMPRKVHSIHKTRSAQRELPRASLPPQVIPWMAVMCSGQSKTTTSTATMTGFTSIPSSTTCTTTRHSRHFPHLTTFTSTSTITTTTMGAATVDVEIPMTGAMVARSELMIRAVVKILRKPVWKALASMKLRAHPSRRRGFESARHCQTSVGQARERESVWFGNVWNAPICAESGLPISNFWNQSGFGNAVQSEVLPLAWMMFAMSIARFCH